MTSTTTDVDQDPPPGPEVGVGAEVVDVSSEISADFAAEKAVDGNLADGVVDRRRRRRRLDHPGPRRAHRPLRRRAGEPVHG